MKYSPEELKEKRIILVNFVIFTGIAMEIARNV